MASDQTQPPCDAGKGTQQTSDNTDATEKNTTLILPDTDVTQKNTTLILPDGIDEEQDTHSCAKCKLVFLNLNDYIMHKLSRDNCKVSYTKSKGSKVLVPTITQNVEKPKVEKPPVKGKKRGPKGPHKKTHPEVILENLPEYNCEHCPKSFRRKAALIRHLEFDHRKGHEGGPRGEEEEEEVHDFRDKDYKPHDAVHIKTEPGTDMPKLKKARLEPKSEHESDPENESSENQFESMSMSGVQILVRPPSKNLVQPALPPDHYKVSALRPFQCETCQRAFKDANVLKAHKLTHSDERDYPCTWDGCSYAFKTKGSLKRHMRRHTGERPFRCDLCGRCFGESGALTRHLKSRTSCTNKADVDLPRYGQTTKFLRDIPAARGKTGELPSKDLAPAKPRIAPPTWTQDQEQGQTIIITQPPGLTLSIEDLKIIGDATGDKSLGDRLQMAEQQVITDENGEEQIVLVIHSEESAPSEPVQQFTCKVCQESFDEKKALLEHLKVHMTVPKYRCDFCNHVAATENELELHLRITHKLTKLAADDVQTSDYSNPQVIQVLNEDGTPSDLFLPQHNVLPHNHIPAEHPENDSTVVVSKPQNVIISDDLQTDHNSKVVSEEETVENEATEEKIAYDVANIISFNEAGEQVITRIDGETISFEDIAEGQVIEEVDSIEEGAEVIATMETLIKNRGNKDQGLVIREVTAEEEDQSGETDDDQLETSTENVESGLEAGLDGVGVVLVNEEDGEDIKDEPDEKEEVTQEDDSDNNEMQEIEELENTNEDANNLKDQQKDEISDQPVDIDPSNIVFTENMDEKQETQEAIQDGNVLYLDNTTEESALVVVNMEVVDDEERLVARPAGSTDTSEKLQAEDDESVYMDESSAVMAYADKYEEENEAPELAVIKPTQQDEATLNKQIEIPVVSTAAASVALKQTLALHDGPSSSKVGNKTVHHCHVCSRTFQSSHYLKLHQRSHVGERPHTCQICKKTFMTRDSLIKHMVVHSSERNCKCGFCGKLFKRISHVREHLKVHNNDRPYPCLMCGKTFKSSNACKVHMRTHSNLMPFECHFCKRTFRERGSLQRHIRTHTGEKPYSCRFCQRSFAEHGTLNRHLKAKVPCQGRSRSEAAAAAAEKPATSKSTTHTIQSVSGGENTVLAEFSTVVADTQQYILSEPQEATIDSSGSQVLVLSEPGQENTVTIQQPILDADQLQTTELQLETGEYTTDQLQIQTGEYSDQLQTGEYSADQLQTGEYSTDQLQTSEYSTDQLQTEEYPTEEVQPGEYTIVERNEDIITLQNQQTGETLHMPADAVPDGYGD